MDKEKNKRAIAKLLYGHYCGDDICGKCRMPHCDCYMIAERIVNANFGNIEEALTEFAAILKETLDYKTNARGMISIDIIEPTIDETLKEFLKQ